MSEILGKPLIAGTDTHSSSKYKSECRAVLLEAKKKSYGDEDKFDLSYKTYDELVNAFRAQGALDKADYMAAIENTNLLYDMTEDIELDTSIKYPILYGTQEADKKKLRETVEEKFNDKLQKGIIPPEQEEGFRAAIPEEIRVFEKLDMSGFMLSMSELMTWCRDNGIPTSPARGSVGGSRVAYITDITDLNPETWHAVFSRFANEDRKEIGDIDIDCIDSDRPRIFKYIIDRFGTDKTARVASFGTMQEKDTIDNIGRYLAAEWGKEHPEAINNPWSLSDMTRIKSEYTADPEKTKKKYPELFYYFDGLVGTKISQSIHPAGMVISPITLADNFGVFDKDGDLCLMLDMDNIHDYTGLAKYDFLILKTVQVVKDTCDYIGIPYPRTHEVDWSDERVWQSMRENSCGIFQFEKKYAFDCLKKFKPTNIFEMSLVTAAIRPSGASYRDELLTRRVHKNPSELIDNLLADNLGYLIYQEDTISFLQQICGLSGSEADNVRRAIGRKQKERLDKAMPDILKGYAESSPKPEDEAIAEAQEFMQILQDSASYQFGKNHSIAYCLLGYICAYFRCYYPMEFITVYLNNAANDEDIKMGSAYAAKLGIKITMPKWGLSKSIYFFDKEKRVIAKGLESVKYIGTKLAEDMYTLAKETICSRFVDILSELTSNTNINTRQVDILIKIDFFSDYGNQRELLTIAEMFFDTFKKGAVKKLSKTKVDGTLLEPIVKKYAVGTTKSGGIAKSYTILDVKSIMEETEDAIKAMHTDDLSVTLRAQNFKDLMGYVGYTTGNEADRRKLYVLDIFPLKRKSDGAQFGYSVITKSIGSGIESRFTVFNRVYNRNPIKKDDIIYCKSFERDRGYFTMTAYDRIF